MASIVSRLSQLMFGAASPSTNLPKATLKSIREARGDINEIRILLKGDEKTCLTLFNEAVQEVDAITQIELSYALAGMESGKDNTKDFSSLSARDLEKFQYYPKHFTLLIAAYKKIPKIAHLGANQTEALQVFQLAQIQNYLPAILELFHQEWYWNIGSYGFAVQLRPFVCKGDILIDYYFGQALRQGCAKGSTLYYEGASLVNKSNGFQVKYPENNQSFDDFKKSYFIEHRPSTSYDLDGFCYVDKSVVLAPSEEKWNNFVQEKLTDIEITSEDSYQFKYDSTQIQSLLKKHRISYFVRSSSCQSSIGNFNIQTLGIDQSFKRAGEISVREDTFEIHETFKNEEIQPIIDFIENVMKRSGSAESANAWLNQIKKD